MAVVKPKRKAYWCDELQHQVLSPDTITVLEEEDEGLTGLLDAKGNPLYREKPRIGFIRRND